MFCAATGEVCPRTELTHRAESSFEPKENRPMTVRSNRRLIMSGLFLAVALVGVVAITITLVPRSAQGILKRARAAGQSQRFADAEIYYKQVLQLEAKNAAVHEELAAMYLEWSR